MKSARFFLVQLLVAVVVLGTAAPLFADIQYFGDLGSSCNITVVETHNPLPSDLRTQGTGADGVLNAYVYLTNNDVAGFLLTIESSHGGRLVYNTGGVFPPSPLEGEYLPYTARLIRGNGGDLGATPVQSLSSLDLSGGPIQITFSDAEFATSGAEYQFYIVTDRKLDLFYGNFKDTVTFTISDL